MLFTHITVRATYFMSHERRQLPNVFNQSAGARGTFLRMLPAFARSGTAPTEKSASTGIGDQAAAHLSIGREPSYRGIEKRCELAISATWCPHSNRWPGRSLRGQPARDGPGRGPREAAAADRLAVESSNARTEHRRSEQPWLPVSMKFRTAKLRRGSPDDRPRPGAARMIEDYHDFPMGSDF